MCAGAGEWSEGLSGWFATAWASDKTTPLQVSGPGDNTLPLIHVTDLVRYIVTVSETLPAAQYLLAVDDAKLSQAEVAQAISTSLGSGATQLTEADSLFYMQVSFPARGRIAWHTIL
jgi:nucleoside-diphosphate-sugar epimerase